MNIKPIKTKKDYEQAMLRLENLFDAKKGTPKGDELEILGLLIEKYEDEKFPIDLPDPIEAIKFRMEQSGFSADQRAAYHGANYGWQKFFGDLDKLLDGGTK